MEKLVLVFIMVLVAVSALADEKMVIIFKNGKVVQYSIEEIQSITFEQASISHNEIQFGSGYEVKEFPVRKGYPYVLEFEFYDDMTHHFFSGGFRKEGRAGVHRDLELQIRPKVNAERYTVSKYTGVIGRDDNEFPQIRTKGWRTVKLILDREGYKIYLDGSIISQGVFTFEPDKFWFRSGLGSNTRQVGGPYDNGVNMVRLR